MLRVGYINGSSEKACFTLAVSIELQLLDYPDVGKIYPADVIARAKHFLANIPGGTGAYSDSRGAIPCREDVCKVCVSPKLPTCRLPWFHVAR